MGTDIVTREQLDRPGDVGIGADNYHFSLIVRCPICEDIHVIAIPCSIGNPRLVWEFNVSTLTVVPSFRAAGHRGVCHFTLTNGVFTIHADSTAKPDA